MSLYSGKTFGAISSILRNMDTAYSSVKKKVKNFVRQDFAGNFEGFHNNHIRGYDRKILKTGALAAMMFLVPYIPGMMPGNNYTECPKAERGILESVETKNVHNINNDINNITIEEMIDYYPVMDRLYFKDNDVFMEYRNTGNKEKIFESEIRLNDLISENKINNILVINKTFQKAAIYRIDARLVGEWDCATALIYGRKERNGDGKTPEGLFHIQSIVPSHYKIYENKKAYGPYFCRLDDPVFRSIGLHGNGTDIVRINNWENDMQYMPPDPLGVSSNNFGYGVSHGCIRLENDIIREKVEDGTITAGMPVIIYEDTLMTYHLNRYYNEKDNYFDIMPGLTAQNLIRGDKIDIREN